MSEPTETQVMAAARAIYEVRPIKKNWWPGIGEPISWDEMVYDCEPLSREPYIERALAALKAAASAHGPSTDKETP